MSDSSSSTTSSDVTGLSRLSFPEGCEQNHWAHTAQRFMDLLCRWLGQALWGDTRLCAGFIACLLAWFRFAFTGLLTCLVLLAVRLWK